MGYLEKILHDSFIQEKLNPLYLSELQSIQKELANLPYAIREETEEKILLFTFRKLLNPFYRSKSPAAAKEIFVITTISSDGIGDYIALNKLAHLLAKLYPHFIIKLAYTYQRELPELPTHHEVFSFFDPFYLIEAIVEGRELPSYPAAVKTLEHELAQQKEDAKQLEESSPLASEALLKLCQELEEQLSQAKQLAHLQKKGVRFYEELKECDSIIHISLALNTFENPLLKGKSLYFSETGNFQGMDAALKLHWFSMGLSPFEEGIFLKDHLSCSSFSDQLPSHFYVSYITQLSEAKLTYLYLICRLQEQGDIHLYLSPLTQMEKESINLEELAKTGIAHLHYLQGAEIKQVIDIKALGKNLYLHEDLPIPFREFLPLLNNSQSPVGCTGDLSLSEVISRQQIPFYEPRKHKQETLEALLKMAQHYKLNCVVDYLTLLQQIPSAQPELLAEKIAKVINGNLFAEWKIILTTIHSYYYLEDAIHGRLNTFFYQIDHPGWRERERQLILGFKERSAEEIYREIRKTAS
ncbi:MAG: hypothetical protein ACSNEK_09660 [Parachlamydiaceae bacterium]